MYDNFWWSWKPTAIAAALFGLTGFVVFPYALPHVDPEWQKYQLVYGFIARVLQWISVVAAVVTAILASPD